MVVMALGIHSVPLYLDPLGKTENDFGVPAKFVQTRYLRFA